jgi:hypothetical protein
MIHSAAVRDIASRHAVGAGFCLVFPQVIGLLWLGTAAAAQAAEPGTVAIFWAPPANPPADSNARAAFADAARSLGARFIDATPPPASTPEPSLVPSLEAAKAAYAKFAFPDAISRLNALERLVERSGGGDLDRRQLSEIFFYRGLAKLETAAEDTWDDLVHAARLDPTRVVDPARFPPRAVSTFNRAAAEAAQAPRAELTLEVPEQSTIRIDGAAGSATSSVTLGPHLVSIAADAYEPWTGVVSVTNLRTRFSPPLRAHQPPQGDRLLALAGPSQPRRLLLGALERRASGWQFTLRDITLPDGRFVSDSITLGEVPTAAAVQALVHRVSPPPARRSWGVWAIAGGAILAIGASIAFALARDGASPNVTGDLGSWR